MCSLHSFSQSFSGQITNTNKEPLENVYVYNLTSNSHTHTNVSGDFILENCKVGDSIEIQILGYQKLKFILNSLHFKKKTTFVLEAKVFLLDELVLTKKMDPIQTIVKIDLEKSPVNSSQDILRKVPGLFIGQHAGGGKAEQIFLRGFDIDHGTDLSLSVDGMPVNMVSHAHGQGYSDLHFIIPETIQNINFGKGPYSASHGDFSTAGFVDFKTKSVLENSEINIGIGQFNTFRTLGMFNVLDNENSQNAYVALEYLATDGFVDSPQNFNRINLFSKYNTFLKDNSKLTLTASHFTSKWDASGQIPQRAIDANSISRFGAIDDTEGGETSRTNLNFEHATSLSPDLAMQTNVFFTKYDFKLFSNFTFFLDDPVNGDQIMQQEDRTIVGFNTKFKKNTKVLGTDFILTIGTGYRNDVVKNVELSHTLNRKAVLNNIQLGDVNQSNYYAFANAEFELEKFTISPAFRLDYLNFQYNDALLPTYKTESTSKAIVNPKLNITYTPNQQVQWFFKSGIGFHSNDTRVVVRQTNKTLPRAYGLDFGNSWKPTARLILNTTLWYLLSEEEFVYVGDAGIVEPSGKSERFGLDLGVRYQFTDWLYFNTDATFTNARSLEEVAGQDFIPLAPETTLTGGLFLNNYKRFSGGINYKYIRDRAANEDNSIVAVGYFVTDANLNYKIKNITLGVSIENLFNVAWNETQFATESRLRNELNSVEEIHFTPGTPFSTRIAVSYTF
ncbi:MAG: TonB-dependent receptor plug domain-containing protein [Polaribacter sp.]|nr:TonB-dependent receptor plug domain-containing protein [Polaribacter sp.]MDG1811090.1 TonB-dependent receptor plug domain-containing protein [Polaribacter sp.]MDG1994290.1 TonB-dependent receptor plug domain-containing protein [Polaribacter sp.]